MKLRSATRSQCTWRRGRPQPSLDHHLYACGTAGLVQYVCRGLHSSLEVADCTGSSGVHLQCTIGSPKPLFGPIPMGVAMTKLSDRYCSVIRKGSQVRGKPTSLLWIPRELRQVRVLVTHPRTVGDESLVDELRRVPHDVEFGEQAEGTRDHRAEVSQGNL